ncbi:MAG: xanthine dehydrogenase [Magnetospirillum sp.]|nr:xanthine dehydrogenase [Magnetospirillum sp.]
MRPEILIRGAGEIASAIAHALHGAKCRVALQVSRPPIAIRRLMAFSDAAFKGSADLEGRRARRIDHGTETEQVWATDDIPLLYMAFDAAIAARPWSVLVDARMNKQQAPDVQIGLAPLVIGLGPGCTAGHNVDIGVETSWDGLGAIIRQGSTLPLAGEPRAILGQARSRFRYAPQAGILCAEAEIGERVRAGQVIARIGQAPITASFDGILRGLTHDGVPVEKGNKIAEIDPRPGAVKLAGIDERPRRLAEAVVAIVADLPD